MNSRKMMLRQNIPALNIYSKSMESGDNLLDHRMEGERERDQKYLLEWTVSTGRYSSVSIRL